MNMAFDVAAGFVCSGADRYRFACWCQISFTLLSLCAGLTAIRMGIEGRYELALAFVVAAGLLDAVDGRAARWLQAQSRFGAELDSLADFVNFGVAPALIIYAWCFKDLTSLKGFGWITVLVFAAAMSLRLARFNSMIDIEKPKWKNNYFTGVPAPAGAITVLLPLYLDGAGLIALRGMPLIVADIHTDNGFPPGFDDSNILRQER